LMPLFLTQCSYIPIEFYKPNVSCESSQSRTTAHRNIPQITYMLHKFENLQD
jgi:hypothetical protein